MTETIGAVLCRAGAVLRLAGIDNPRREARLLLSHALGMSPEALLRDTGRPADARHFDALLARRAAREPMALILGHRGFWTLDLAVSAATLIPRPDSETLIEAAIACRPDRHAIRSVLDLGTGTGCLLLAALSEFPESFGVGIDRAPGAAALAARNAVRLGLASRTAFLCADWAAPLAARFDLVLCNPPYIATDELAGLMPEVALHEPRSALDGGADGLDAYRRLIPGLAAVLADRGLAILELGAGQAVDVTALARKAGLHATIRRDLAGVARALILRLG